MTDQLHCAGPGCGHRFGKRSTGLLVFESFVLCRNCSNNLDVHQKLFFNCHHRHTPRDHAKDGAVFVSRGLARQIMSPTTSTN